MRHVKAVMFRGDVMRMFGRPGELKVWETTDNSFHYFGRHGRQESTEALAGAVSVSVDAK